jgi:hypothetical protein
MRPQRVIIAVFAALVSQGNIASALPQGPNYTRSENIDGRSTSDMIVAGEALPDTEISMNVVRSNQAPEERGVQERTSAADAAGYVSLGLTAGGMVISGTRWFFMKTEVGKKLLADGKAKARVQHIALKEAAKEILKKLRSSNPTATQNDVELAIQQHGGIIAVPANVAATVAGSPAPGSDAGSPAPGSGAGSTAGSDTSGSFHSAQEGNTP